MRNGATIYGGINSGIKWNPLALYGGGFVTGLDVGPGGVVVARTDTAGSWLWDPTALQWSKLLRPGDNIAISQCKYNYLAPSGVINGTFDVAIAPSDANTIYDWEMGYVYVTTNKGSTFTRTALAQITGLDPNDNYRAHRKKMIVDSGSAAVCALFDPTATTGGMQYTINTGTAWTKSASVPAGNGQSGCIAYDRDSTLTSGVHQRWGVYVPGNGLWVSTTGLAGTFTKDTGYTGGAMTSLVMFGNGVIVCCDGTNIYRRTAAGVWSTVSTQATYSLALNFADTTKLVGIMASGTVLASSDSGVTWTTDPGGVSSRTASDVPWLATTNENYMTSGMIAYDTATAGKLIFCEGVGVWYGAASYTQGVRPAWTSMNKGLRGMITQRVLFTPSGDLLWCGQDRNTATFARTRLDTSPSQVGIDNVTAILHGCDRDYAIDNENYQVVATYGTNPIRITSNGRSSAPTWTVPAGSLPNAGLGGNVAVGNAGNIVVLPADNYAPFYTTDDGTTWAHSKFGGITLPALGNGSAQGVKPFNSMGYRRKVLVADKENPGCFWFYCCGTDDATGSGPANDTAYAGLWRSTDSGANFTRIYTGHLDPSFTDFYHSHIVPVRGKPGHLFWYFGDASLDDVAGSANYKLKFSSDYGATWTALPGMLEAEAMCEGAAAPGVVYKTLYAYGYTAASDNTARVFARCTNFDPANPTALTWTAIGANPYPLGDFHSGVTLAAHPTEFGLVAMGKAASSVVYGQYDDTMTVT